MTEPMIHSEGKKVFLKNVFPLGISKATRHTWQYNFRWHRHGVSHGPKQARHHDVGDGTGEPNMFHIRQNNRMTIDNLTYGSTGKRFHRQQRNRAIRPANISNIASLLKESKRHTINDVRRERESVTHTKEKQVYHTHDCYTEKLLLEEEKRRKASTSHTWLALRNAGIAHTEYAWRHYTFFIPTASFSF